MKKIDLQDLYWCVNYGIVKCPDGRYLIPSVEANSLDFLDGEESIDEYGELKELNIENLIVKPCDTLLVTCSEKKEEGYAVVDIKNLRNGTHGTALDYFWSDDGRYYFAMKIAREFAKKIIRAVGVKVYLIYTAEETAEYVKVLENI